MTSGLNTLLVPNVAAGLNSLVGFASLFDILGIVTLVTGVIFAISAVVDMKEESEEFGEMREPLLI